MFFKFKINTDHFQNQSKSWTSKTWGHKLSSPWVNVKTRMRSCYVVQVFTLDRSKKVRANLSVSFSTKLRYTSLIARSCVQSRWTLTRSLSVLVRMNSFTLSTEDKSKQSLRFLTSLESPTSGILWKCLVLTTALSHSYSWKMSSAWNSSMFATRAAFLSKPSPMRTRTIWSDLWTSLKKITVAQDLSLLSMLKEMTTVRSQATSAKSVSLKSLLTCLKILSTLLSD